ncbi:aldo/keto reductase [Actinophytocola oryzae]|uniref:Aryl-alcohol dehydrogenase-like predicted oxidoreductase n=1 Tax=Actinophytocola oryzae TaxID=502181 RepID=A0A4R7UYA5_9PSEU|nr:aldo/keto reductase [Actinophytocola oryzae]TDV41117.1 aryl-alcohol dehydrogenase-like predicted oxidoreductase [Actinophytocola oryzae]
MTTVHHTPGGTTLLAGRRVARVGFGAMQLEGGTDRAAAVAVLRAAADLGVNHIDTAEFYGAANALIREALHPYPENLALVSKVGAEREGAGLVLAQRPEQLRASVEANLTSLRVDSLAVVNLRRGDAPPGIIAEGDQVVDLDSQLAELVALRDEGKIGGIGLSNVSVDQLGQALPAGIVCVQNAHSVLDRTAEPVLDVCREHDIAWVPFFPLGSAFPGIRKTTEHPAVIAAAARVGATPAQVSLAWLLTHYTRTLLIPGTGDPDHLAENVAAGAVHLDPDAMAALSSL